MQSIFDDAARHGLEARLRRLRPDAVRRWGQMSPALVAGHLTEALRMALGERLVPFRWTPLCLTPIKQCIIYVAPFPKGAPTAPELLARAAADLPSEIETACGLLERCARPGHRLAPAHPLFGTMTRRMWGVLIYRHTDHHLRQFGV